MWFLNLPDILVFLAIWGCGFLTGVFIVIMVAFIFVMINFLVDIAYYFIDPRIRIKEEVVSE